MSDNKPADNEEPLLPKEQAKEEEDRPVLGFVLINLFILGGVLTNMFFKEAMNEGMTAIEVGLQRSVFCMVVYGVFLIPFKQNPLGNTDTEQRWLLVLRGVVGQM